MAFVLVQGSSPMSTELGTCGNCQIAFQRECSKVRQIIVRDFSLVDGQQEEEIISINEALSVIFEIPPLTPNESSEGNSTKKEAFNSGSKFSSSNVEKTSDGMQRDCAVCVQCSEKLKDLYRCFQNFTKVCKLESQIGRILQSLGKESSNARLVQEQGGTDIEGVSNNGVRTRSHKDFTISVRVKTEPAESEDEQENVNENRNDDDHFDDDQASPSSSPLPSYSNDEYVQQSNIKQSPRGSENGNEDLDVSENEENSPKSNKAAVQKVSIKLADGHGIITQLKCPKCNKQFLHENTLICHRRIVHRENIKIQPPSPLPAVKLSKEGIIERRKALAESNGKTSSCPICRVEVPRTEIRHHLSIHTRSLTKPWLCTICGRNFNGQTDLQEHAKVHICGIPCKRCGKKVPTLNMLTHIRQCMKLAPESGKTVLDFSCKVCCKMFRTREKLLEHRSRVHAHFWRCKLCGIKFVERKKMHKHMNTHKQKKGRKCKICDKSFDRIDVLRLHIKRFHRNNEGPATPAPYIPPSPPAPYNPPSPPAPYDPPSPPDHDPLSLSDHEDPSSPAEHSPATLSPLVQKVKLQPYKMKMVRSPYKKKNLAKGKAMPPTNTAGDPSSASADLNTPILDDRFICKGCNQSFPRGSDLDTHLLEAHTDQESFLCKICNRKLQDSYCLKLHVKIHGEMKPMECCVPSCGKMYRDRNTFFYHLKEKHLMDTKSIVAKYPDVFRQRNRDYSTRSFGRKIGQMPREKGEFPCEVCGRVFTQIYGLRNHIKLVHDKVKDFLCKYCGKAFARKSYFLLHEKLHTTNDSPYKCHLCNKGFRLPGNLRVHLKSTIHNPNKDFVCDICGKRFNRNDNLRLHVKTVHLKIPAKKPKSEASDRYTHGGRNRIYMEVHNESDDYRTNASAVVESSPTTVGPLPGTSQSFMNLQNELYQQFSSSTHHATHSQQQNMVDAASMDSSSQVSGDGSNDSCKPSLNFADQQHHHQHAAHISSLSMPNLQVQHPLNVRSNSDATADSGSSDHHSFPNYNFRGFQYR